MSRTNAESLADGMLDPDRYDLVKEICRIRDDEINKALRQKKKGQHNFAVYHQGRYDVMIQLLEWLHDQSRTKKNPGG